MNIPELGKWIQAHCLDNATIEHLRGLSMEELNSGVCLDNFLHEEHIDRLQEVIDKEAVYKEHFKLFGSSSPVSREMFLAAPEKERFLYRRYINAALPEYKKSHNWLSYREFQLFFIVHMPAFLGDIFKLKLKVQNQFTHSHQKKHYLKAHNDELDRRKICTVLYLSRDWKREYGGSLHMECKDGSEKIIEPLCNRLLIFFPYKYSKHFVERHTELAKEKTRTCHVTWYGI